VAVVPGLAGERRQLLDEAGDVALTALDGQPPPGRLPVVAPVV
jgi:hypothetical protein